MTLDEIEAAARNKPTLLTLDTETILALCADLRACHEALDKIDSWLVCCPIASPSDMAQSFSEMIRTTQEALQNLKKHWGV